MANHKQIARWIWVQSAGSRWGIWWICCLGFLRVTASLTFVWMCKQLVDAAVDHADGGIDAIVRYAACLVGLRAFELGCSAFSQRIRALTEARMKNDMRHRVYTRLLASTWGDRAPMHSGDLLNRITEDVRVITDVVCSSLPDFIIMATQLIGALALLYSMSAALAYCLVGIMPLFLLFSKVYVRKMRAVTSDIRRSDSLVHSNIQEGVQHRAVVQTLECQAYMGNKLDGLQTDLMAKIKKRMRISVFSRLMVSTGFSAGFLTVFIWSAWHLHLGTITFGTMTAFLQLVARVQNPMSNLTQLVPSFVHALSSADRLIELESLPEEKKGDCKPLKRPVGVRINGVSFHYHGSDREVLSDFSYDFAPGSKTVVMGETGIGKTTLVRLLLALQTPQQGTIEVYDSEQAVPADSATRCNMVYVPQGNSLLDGTILDNLRLAKPDATEAEVREALHTAVADFAYELPLGLDTPCGELGTALSEGQAQCIAIARALLRGGSVLLLDEFNSALDETTAATLLRRLTAERPDCTIIFISHRPEVISYSDAVLRLERQQ